MSSSTTLTNLVDLAVELINDAKTSKDVKSKLYYLEQVKEIVLFRDTSILIGLIPDIMDFMVETSSQIKKFLIQFCGEALKKTVLISPYVLSLLNFYCTDNNDDLIRFIASELRISYSRLVIFVVNLNVKSKSSTNDPKVLWSQLQHIVEKVIETISSDDKSEITRVQCLRALESIVQFGIPNIEAAKVVDPRLKAKKVEVAVSESTSTEIPLHHQFISRTDIEQEAESLFSKMLLWANKGGPQSHPFTPHQMAQLGQSIANLSSVRHKLLTQASPAVMAILSKPNLCESMSGQHREHFARALHRMMRSLSFQTDSNLKVVITKVRAALERLEGLGFQGQSDVSGRKRTADSTQVVDVDDIEEEDLEAIQLRNSAIEALKASEKNIKLKSAKLSTSTDATRSKDSTISIDNTQSLVFSMSGETELALPSADLEQGVIPALMADVRMSSNLSFGLLQDISASSGGFICVDPVPQPLDAYPLLATASLLRILQCISVGDHKMVTFLKKNI